MNKAKIMLSAIAVLAVIGTGLAFKAKNPIKTFYKYGTIISNANTVTGCVVPVALTYVTTTTTLATTTIPYLTTQVVTTAPALCVTTVLTADAD